MSNRNYEKELERLITIVVNENASDLHFLEGRPPIIRVSGFLIPLVKHTPLSKEDILNFLGMMVSPAYKERFLKTQELDFSYSFKKEARFRGNAYFQQESPGIALRFISHRIRSLKELSLPASLEQFAYRQQGFFLVVGPVGHGKTTTLAALIEMINATRAEHIMTIEDPIEYVYEQKKSVISQREVGVDTEGFHTALTSVFRQDIDVLLVGEMRDVETISTAVTAAETGHLVFSTLHTNNAAQTISRIIDSFPGDQQSQIRAQLAASLSGIFSQRLIPRISGGLVPAYELLINTTAVSNLIREERTHEIHSVIETGTENGMIDMNRSLAELVRAGEITVEHARAFSMNPEILMKLI